jgi:coiled-coil domain-containing protein 6
MSREKEMIENQLEAEQEYIVNKLQKQAMGLAAEKQALQLEKTDLKRQVPHYMPTPNKCQTLC